MALSAVKHVALGNPGFDDPRGAVASIAARWQPGDHIYASGAGLPPLMYYGTIFHPGSHLSFVSPRKPAYTPREEAPCVPLPAHEGRLWFIWFVPNEMGYDRTVLRHFNQSAMLLQSAQFKHYIVSVWRLAGP
jgi:hypothetical protein